MSESNQTVEALQRQVSDLTARCTELQSALSEMETLHDDLEQSSKLVEQELEDTIKELEETAARQAEQLRQVELELERSEREKRERTSAVEAMKRAVEEERERGVVTRRESSAQIEELKESVTRLTRDYEAVKTQLVSVEQENERLERVERTLSDQVKRDREVTDKQLEEITYLHTERDELTDLLQRARDEIKDLKAELMARDLTASKSADSTVNVANDNHVPVKSTDHLSTNHVPVTTEQVSTNHVPVTTEQVSTNHVPDASTNHVTANKSPRNTPRTMLSVQSVALVDEMLSLVQAMEQRLHRAGDGS